MSGIDWQDGNFPVSNRFDDPYYSRADGQKETEYVFINGNNLPQRWPTKTHWIIGELGFGTGLNFLETWRHWQKLKTPDQSLQFVSFEQFPLSREDLIRALSRWKNLGDVANILVEKWEPEKEVFELSIDDSTKLTVNFGDANRTLPTLDFHSDAWYLDGFSPAKNEELWNKKLMSEVAKHTISGGTFATYTSAGYVRRNLQDAGFSVQKIKGFGHKRDMLTGSLPGQ